MLKEVSLNILLLTIATLALAEGFLIPNNLPASLPSSSNRECQKESELFLRELKKNTRWAHLLQGASAREMRNFLKGSIYFFGDIEDCFNNEIPFRTRFCMAEIHVDESTIPNCLTDYCDDIYDDLRPSSLYTKVPRNPLHWAICSPASCSIQELENETQKALDSYANNTAKLKIKIFEKDCQYPREEKLNCLERCFVAVTCSLILLVIASTFYKDRLCASLVYCFSARNSWKQLTNFDNVGEAMQVLNFFKVWFVIHLLTGHFWCIYNTGSIANQNYIETTKSYFGHTLIYKQETVVECFLGLGGLLTAYSFMKRCPSPFRSIARRYFRFAPLMAYTILYYVSFMSRGLGALWKYLVEFESENCKKNWWLNLLFLNNYVDTTHLCMIQSWYISVDFHCYIVTIILFLFFQKNWKMLYSAIMACFMICTLWTFCVAFFNGSRPFDILYNNTFLTMRTKGDSSFLNIYIPTHTRGNVYFTGVLIGILYHTVEKYKNFKLSPTWTVAGLTFGLLLSPYGLNPILTDPSILPVDGPYTIWHAIYAALHRPIAAIGMFTISFTVSFTSYSGIRRIINNHVFTVLSRLTYGMYLFHLAIQIRDMGNLREPLFLTIYYWWQDTISDIIICYLFSFIAFFLVESPFARVFEKVWPSKSARNESVNNKKDN